MTTKTRFAPSPTGYLHIGGVRTALFSWLYARKHNGQFVLRIEDTDRERSTEEAVQVILQGMQWLGLNHDEGPVYQTQRFDRYREVIQQLLDSGHAYECYCSKERLERLRETQMQNKQKPRYDGHCRELQVGGGLKRGEAASQCVIRFRNPDSGNVVFDDLVRGRISISNEELDDLIIARSDSTPTYNFTVVVDDMDMQISQVIRGDDHINNTPRQINIFRALGAEPPQYGHVPMILAADGKRLSKRHGAVSVMQYKEQGYLPEALLNYLLRLGWSYGDQEIFSIAEMIELFDIKAVNKAAATFNPEKLLWLNQHYLKTLEPQLLEERLKPLFEQAGIDLSNGPDLEDLLAVQRERCKTLLEIVETSRFFYQDFEQYDEKAAHKNLNAEATPVIEALLSAYQSLNDWEVEPIHQIVKDIAEQHTLKMGKVAQPLRVAVTGNTSSPSIDITLKLIGKERVISRLQHALARTQAASVN